MINNINRIKRFSPLFLYIFLKKIYHLLRYFNLINPDYNSKNNIKFGDEETGNFLKNKIRNSHTYLEFGSGNTTIFAADNNKQYFSIESDRNFYYYIKKKNLKNVYFHGLGPVEFYSYPLFNNLFFKNFYKKRSKIYSSEIFKKFDNDLIFPDLILVDGRYRVLCMLNIFIFLKKNNLTQTCVILDDFKHREYYKILNNFFSIKLIGRLGICYFNNQAPTSEIDNLIDKFSEDPR